MLLTCASITPDVVIPGRLPSKSTGMADPQLRDCVWQLLSNLYRNRKGGERRRDRRYPFPQLLHLTPVAADGIEPVGKAVVVSGKHLSEQGVGFFHREPLPFRRVITSIDRGDQWLAFVTDVSWCRFTRLGWYESGGRFLQVVESPVPTLRRETRQQR